MALTAAITAILDLPIRSWIALACLIALGGLLLSAALSDLRRRRISNELCIAVAVMALPYWLAIEPTFGRFAIQLSCGVIVGLVLAVPFGYHLLGGGDVKLMAALALWILPYSLYETMLMVAMGGGVLAIVVIVLTYRSQSCRSVPYGVAIAAAGLYRVGSLIKHLVG
jgi:prepilin peptidase CpaA